MSILGACAVGVGPVGQSAGLEITIVSGSAAAVIGGFVVIPGTLVIDLASRAPVLGTISIVNRGGGGSLLVGLLSIYPAFQASAQLYPALTANFRVN